MASQEWCRRRFSSKLHNSKENHALTRIGAVPTLAALVAAAGVFQQH